MSLWQAHWLKDGDTSGFILQQDIQSMDEMQKFVDDVSVKYKKPEGAVLMMCDKRSKFFVAISK